MALYEFKTAQLTENGTEIVVCFARFALELPFYPLWLIVLAYGAHGAKNVILGDFAHFGITAR